MLNITREEALFELLKSLNQGNTNYSEDRVYFAKKQIESLEKAGITFKEEVVYDKR